MPAYALLLKSFPLYNSLLLSFEWPCHSAARCLGSISISGKWDPTKTTWAPCCSGLQLLQTLATFKHLSRVCVRIRYAALWALYLDFSWTTFCPLSGKCISYLVDTLVRRSLELLGVRRRLEQTLVLSLLGEFRSVAEPLYCRV